MTNTPLTFTVKDSSTPQLSKSASLTLTIAPPPIVISTTSLPDGIVGTAYSATACGDGRDGADYVVANERHFANWAFAGSGEWCDHGSSDSFGDKHSANISGERFEHAATDEIGERDADDCDSGGNYCFGVACASGTEFDANAAGDGDNE